MKSFNCEKEKFKIGYFTGTIYSQSVIDKLIIKVLFVEKRNKIDYFAEATYS